MAAAGVPTAALLDSTRVPCVLKADGLAAGKGSSSVGRRPSSQPESKSLADSATDVVVEELLDGPEVSLFAVCDGTDALVLAPSRDFKRAYDGDEGPNTGGMGRLPPFPTSATTRSTVWSRRASGPSSASWLAVEAPLSARSLRG